MTLPTADLNGSLAPQRHGGHCPECRGFVYVWLDTDGMGNVIERYDACEQCEAKEKAKLRLSIYRLECRRDMAEFRDGPRVVRRVTWFGADRRPRVRPRNGTPAKVTPPPTPPPKPERRPRYKRKPKRPPVGLTDEQVMALARDMLLAGETVGGVAHELGLRNHRVRRLRNRLRDDGHVMLCRCGLDSSHPGLCSARRAS